MGKVRPSTPLARADQWFERVEARLSALERRGQAANPEMGKLLGYNDRNSSATTSGTNVLTVVSVTVDVEADRRLLFLVNGVLSQSNSGDIFISSIRESGTEIARLRNFNDTANVFLNGSGIASLPLVGGSAPSAGSHTYSLTLQRVTGSGTASFAASTGVDRTMLAVLDVGPA